MFARRTDGQEDLKSSKCWVIIWVAIKSFEELGNLTNEFWEYVLVMLVKW